jgi:hypothetical protein
VKVYKANINTSIFDKAWLVLLVIVITPFSSKLSSNGWIFLLILYLIIIGFNVFTSRLNEIILNETNASLIFNYKNFIGIKKTSKYNIYKIEFTYKSQAKSLYGGLKNICTVYYAGKKIIQIVPDEDNWADDEIRNFVYGLINLNIKKKIIDYSAKDVDI